MLETSDKSICDWCAKEADTANMYHGVRTFILSEFDPGQVEAVNTYESHEAKVFCKPNCRLQYYFGV